MEIFLRRHLDSGADWMHGSSAGRATGATDGLARRRGIHQAGRTTAGPATACKPDARGSGPPSIVGQSRAGAAVLGVALGDRANPAGRYSSYESVPIWLY